MSLTQLSQDASIHKLVDQILKEGDEPRRPAEVVRLIIDLGAAKVEQILGLTVYDPLFTQEIQALIFEIRRLITLDTPNLAQEIENRIGFERTKILNALPLECLIRIHNYLRYRENDSLRIEVYNAINRDPLYVNRIKQVNTRVVEYAGGRLPNGITEAGVRSSYDIEEI